MTKEDLLQKYKSIFAEEFEGASVEEAIKSALSSLKMSKDELKIKILFEGYKGLFGLRGAKPAKIKVYPNLEKIENVVKFYVIKLLNFVKDEILLIETSLDKNTNTLMVTVIFNTKEAFELASSKEVYSAFCILLEAFVKKLSSLYTLKIEFKKANTLK